MAIAVGTRLGAYEILALGQLTFREGGRNSEVVRQFSPTGCYSGSTPLKLKKGRMFKHPPFLTLD